MREYLLVLLVAASVTYLLTPVARVVALRLGAMTEVRDRDVHDTPTPRLGGLAMYVGFLVALSAARLMDRFDPLFARNSEPKGVVLASTVIIAVGLWDDIKGLSAPAKVTGTVVAGLTLVWFGVTIALCSARTPW